MKKVMKSLALTGLALGFASMVQAADSVQVTLTSPVVNGQGCEKIGAVTFDFDSGTVLQEGDWWYMDLASGATFCKAINYFVVGDTGVGVTADTVSYDTGTAVSVDGDNALLAGAALAIDDDLDGAGALAAIAIGGTETKGPFSAKNDIGSAATVDALTPVNGGVVLKVSAASGGNRLMVQVLGADNNAADSTVTVNNGITFSVTFGDGQAYQTEILLNTDTDTVWGELAADTINNAGTFAIPFVENTFCATNITGTLYTSFASLNDFLTFTGDSQIAHMGSLSLTLESCDKNPRYIPIATQGTCSFNYEAGTRTCNSTVTTKLYIQASSVIGDPGDKYDIDITSDTAGVYFGGVASVTGFTPSQTPCVDAGTAGITTTNRYAAGSLKDTDGAVLITDTSCSVESKRRVNHIYSEGGRVTPIHTYDALQVVLPTMIYDTSVIGDGVEADVTVSLHKYPCGLMFSDSYTIGTFVTTCPTTTAAGTTTLLYPFLPPMDGSVAGWWGGFTIVNGGTSAGTCTLTYTEADGDVATYTTASIPAAGQVTGPALSSLSASSANSGTFGDANVAITATCQFASGAGFAFTGNGNEGTGYTAYSSAW